MSDTIANGHVPVLLEEVLDALAIRADGRYVDATFGRGGHARAILGRLGPAGRLHGLDRDPQAIAEGERLAAADDRFSMARAELAALEAALAPLGPVHGILMDLGVSSPQLDDAARGFSFLRDGPLDMRMDPSRGEALADFLARSDEESLADTLYELGEERHSRRIARAVLAARDAGELTGTAALADVVARAHPRWPRDQHPATRTFLALRLRVNDELAQLRQGLAAAVAALLTGGRLVVISFHSLEDRIVKRFMADASGQGAADPRLARLPMAPAAAPARLRRVGRPVRAGAKELAANPRARSAILRVAEKLEAAA